MHLFKEDDKWQLKNKFYTLEICLDKQNTPGRLYCEHNDETNVIENMRAEYKYEVEGKEKLVRDCFVDGTEELMKTEEPEVYKHEDYIEISVTSISRHFKIVKRYITYEGNPFLRCRYELYPTANKGKGPASLVFPLVKLAQHIIDPIEKDEDYYSDGTDLGVGFEIPPWRVFAGAEGKPGLFVFTHNKSLMKQMHIMHGKLGFRHSAFESYSGAKLPGWETGEKGNIGPVQINDFFLAPIAPGKEAQFQELIKRYSIKSIKTNSSTKDVYIAHSLAKAELIKNPLKGLKEISKINIDLIIGGTQKLMLKIPKTKSINIPKNEDNKGVKIKAVKIDEINDIYELRLNAEKDMRPKKIIGKIAISSAGLVSEFLLNINVFKDVKVKTVRNECAKIYDVEDLFTSRSKSNTIDENKWLPVKNIPGMVSGKVMVAKGASNAPNITFNPQLKGMYNIYVGVGCGAGIAIKLSSDDYLQYINNEQAYICAFSTPISNYRTPREIYYKTADLTNEKITIGRYPSSAGVTMIDYIKLVPADKNNINIDQKKNKEFKLTGFNDIPDIGSLLGANAPDPEPYLSNVAAHAELGFDRVYWRVDGQCCDFHTKVGTIRYPSAKVHDLFVPSSRGYGRFLAKHDALALAVKEAHKRDLKIYGWWRMNNYGLNVIPEFYKKHPEYHELGPEGEKIPKLCFAIPEVRKWKIDILKEVAERGVDGIVLGALRHPPMLNYHPVLVNGFKEKYGVNPPLLTQPPKKIDQLTEKWLYYRANFLTMLVKELIHELNVMGKNDIKLSVWIRPSCYLYDGIDLERWLDEGLIQEVIVGPYRQDTVPGPVELQKKIQAKAEMQVEISGFKTDKDEILKEIDYFKSRNVDGICIYESDLAVLRPAWRSIVKKNIKSIYVK